MGQEDSISAETYDILLVGKTGLGKSTTARKLLEWEREGSIIRSVNLEIGRANETPGASKLECGGGLEHVTREFQAWENTVTQVRVVDIPGFSDTERHFLLDVRGKNLAIAYRISRLTKKFHFRRILYFIPTRGLPERLDGSLKEELQLLYKFFGDSVFNQMIVVCTNDPDPRYQELRFNIEAARKLLTRVIIDITGKDQDYCRKLEILYIPLDENNVLQKIKDTYQKTPNVLEINPATCMKCLENIEEKCHPKFQRIHTSHSTKNAYKKMSEDEQLIYEFYYDSECTGCRRPPGTEGCTEIDSDTRHSCAILDTIDSQPCKAKQSWFNSHLGAIYGKTMSLSSSIKKSIRNFCDLHSSSAAATTADKEGSDDLHSSSAVVTTKEGSDDLHSSSAVVTTGDIEGSGDLYSSFAAAATTDKEGSDDLHSTAGAEMSILHFP